MPTFNRQTTEELTSFINFKDCNFKKYISDVIGNIVYRYELRYNTSVLGIQYFLLETNGELIGEQYYPISECLHMFDDTLSFQVFHDTVTKELYLQVQTRAGTCLLQLALITSTNQNILHSVRNNTIESIHHKLSMQKSTKEFLAVLRQIDEKHCGHLYK